MAAWCNGSLSLAAQSLTRSWVESTRKSSRVSASQTGAPDADYALVKTEFSESEQVNLTLAIGSINLWNRLQVGFRAVHPADVPRHAA